MISGSIKIRVEAKYCIIALNLDRGRPGDQGEIRDIVLHLEIGEGRSSLLDIVFSA